jgi:hypothetical protein
MELSQRFQDLIQDLRNHDEEQLKIKLKESMAQRDAEFSQKEKVRIVFVMILKFFAVIFTSLFIINLDVFVALFLLSLLKCPALLFEC